MNTYNLNNKKFTLIENSDIGEVDSTTIFEYQQKENLVTAEYYGGTIKYGKIIAHIENNELNMLYQCSTIANELKAGKAKAIISTTTEGKIKLSLDWEWLTENGDKRKSEYIEV